MNIIDLSDKIPICNYSKDRKGYYPYAIVLHITGDSEPNKSSNYFQNPKAKVSAHYVIEKDGTIKMCVNPDCRAYHCGIVNKPTAQIYFDKNSVNPNNYTIGIECVSNGESLTASQYASLTELLIKLTDDYIIPRDRYHIIGHNELDSIDRTFDPISSYTCDEILKRIEEAKMESKTITTLEEAIQFLVAEKVLNSADYRKKVCDVVNFEKEFTINVANRILELKHR